MAQPLIVVTLNTWKGDGAYKARLRLMTEEIRRLDADILLLQECFAAPELGCDTVATFAGAASFYVARWDGRQKLRLCEGTEATSTSGLAVLSRHPILKSWAVDLPSDPRDGDRAALFAKIDHPAGTVLAVSLHLTHLRDAQALRRLQFETVMTELAGMKPARLVLVGGDFNAASDAAEFADAHAPNDFRLVDCRHLAGLPPEATCGETCIDHILLLVPPDIKGPQVADVSTIFDRPDPETGLLASDHFGVKASIILPATPLV